MFGLLRRAFCEIVRDGNLVVTDAAGARHVFGDGRGPECAIRLTDRRLERELGINPQLHVGKAYMEGRFVVEKGSIYEVLALLVRNFEKNSAPNWLTMGDRLRLLTKRLEQYNPVTRSAANVSHHYDLDLRFFDLFLDSDRQYSCAYFEEGANLETAQVAKKRHLAAKLLARPGQRILDIGCGWGGLALYLAGMTDSDVTGITLSREQLEVSRDRARREGMQEAVRFELEDYRNVSGRFDRIVSVGMFEHVGVTHYSAFFRKIRDLLAEDGIALIHTIGRSGEPGVTNQFIAKYIFPGGYMPALSEIMPAVERAGLVVTDIEVLRLHYAETLKAWRERFLANRAKAVELRGESFTRMWEFYLAASEAAFRFQGLVVFQIQLARRQEVVPLTRDYLLDEETRLRRLERQPGIERLLAGE